MQGRLSELIGLTVLLAVVSLPFLLGGHALDIASANLFGTPTGFPFENDATLDRLRDVNEWIIVAVLLACLGAVLLKIARPGTAMRLRPRAIVFLLATLLVGPGLVANTLLKDNWGRPRPREIVEFGGEDPFVKPWIITDHCDDNCSFVSGEGASGMWTVAPAILAPGPVRPVLIVAAVGWGIVMGLVRIAMGGHFLSDVLIGAVLMLIIIWVFKRLLYVAMPDRWDMAAEAALARAGRRLRAIARQR